jgi:hypothetical protein
MIYLWLKIKKNRPLSIFCSKKQKILRGLFFELGLIETLHKKQLTADNADFADLTLILLLKLKVELQKTVKIEKNQR